jgi:hypothetical protein
VMPPTCGTKHSGRGQYETTNLPSESDKLRLSIDFGEARLLDIG